MAIIRVNLPSQYLRRNVSFCGLLPTRGPQEGNENTTHPYKELKTLYMLHGYGGDCNDYLHGPELQELSNKYNLACIFPNGENSFYLEDVDKSENFSAFIGKE